LIFDPDSTLARRAHASVDRYGPQPARQLGTGGKRSVEMIRKLSHRLATSAPFFLEIVVVSYNCPQLLHACLSSVETAGTTRGRIRTHVVDNASTDGTAEMVSDEFPAVKLTALTDNAGFSAANTLAPRDTVAPFVLLLNPDTELRPGALDHLLDLMDSQPDIGMSSCRLELRDGSFDHAAKRAFPTPLAALAHFTRIGRGTSAGSTLAQYRAPDVDERGFGDVDAVNGAFMLVRREALEQVGLLDEGYWLYMEDLDWCRRFHLAGWRVVYDGRVSILHVKGGTAGARRRLRQNVAFHRGMGRFYRRYESGRRPLLDLAVYVGIGAKLAVSITANAVARRRA
jgi:N-acetylglucosaminyl-diphospho-decaprenol L-rhamnosyltransferase